MTRGAATSGVSTQNLHENYWVKGGKKELKIDNPPYETYQRWIPVPFVEYDDLNPSVGDFFYGDTEQIVTNVHSGGAVSGHPDNCWMVVTYRKFVRWIT